MGWLLSAGDYYLAYFCAPMKCRDTYGLGQPCHYLPLASDDHDLLQPAVRQEGAPA